MNTSTISGSRKATIIPVPFAYHDLELPAPFGVAKELTFENVQDLLKPNLFDLWRDMVSKQERDDLARVRFALVHRFQSGGHIGREEAESDDFAFKVFLCLSLIKPTRTAFQRIQVRLLEQNKAEVFSFQHPQPPPNIPDAESLNFILMDDIQRLRTLLPKFLDLVANGPEHVRRAVRHFNVGYNEVRDPTVQIVIWAMGIESLFASQGIALSRSELLSSVDKAIGLDTSIYEPSPMLEYIGSESFPVGVLLEDLLTLRDHFVHGLWIPGEWKTKIGRQSLSERITYADVLREAASYILRKSILRNLEQRSASAVGQG